jgi:hypothetical protein
MNGSVARMLKIWMRGKLSDQRETSFREATSLMKALEFDSSDEECWLLALETGSGLNLFDIAKKSFNSFLFSGLIENRIGEIPEIYTKKRDMCRRLMDRASVGEVKSYLKSCLEAIERDISNHLKDDEEFLNPK